MDQTYPANLVQNKHYCAVDLCKFICALLVVAIHTHPLSSYSAFFDYVLCQYLARIAVPFFFVSSGFFLFRKTSYKEFNVKIPIAYAKRMLWLYIIWTIIYMPLILISIFTGHRGVLGNTLAWLRNLVFTGGYLHLWYLNASVIASLILMVFIRKKVPLKFIVILASFVYAIGLLPQTYFGLIRPLRNVDSVWIALKFVQQIIVTTMNGLFFGFPFMLIGLLYAYKPINMKMKKAIVGFLISMFLFLVEAIAVQYFNMARDYSMYICLIPVVFFLFYITTHVDLKNEFICKYLRHQSSLIFYLHPFVIRIINLFGAENSVLLYFATLIVTILIAHCTIMLSNVKKLAILKKLYA